MYTRICTMCRSTFQYEPRPGRPPTFCSEACKQRAKTDRNRYCITCGESFVANHRAFYCKEACKTAKATLCRNCARPSDDPYCSVTCVLSHQPPPYKCLECNKPFTPSNELITLAGPPKFCSKECFSNRISGARPSLELPRLSRLKQREYQFALNLEGLIKWDAYHSAQVGWNRAPLDRLEFLPVQPNGEPYTGVPHKLLFPVKRMPWACRNTIAFWDYMLTDPFSGIADLDPKMYTAYISHYVCSLGGLPWDQINQVGLLPGNHLWPYISPYVDLTLFKLNLFKRLQRNYNRTLRQELAKSGCPPRKQMEELLLRVEINYSMGEFNVKENRNAAKEREHWRRPFENDYAAHKRSLIQMRASTHARIVQSVSMDMYADGYDEDEMRKLHELHQEVIEHLHEYVNPASLIKPKRGQGTLPPVESRKPWPWGPNCYNEMVDEFQEDGYRRRLADASLGVYNYPPFGSMEDLRVAKRKYRIEVWGSEPDPAPKDD